MSEPEEHSQADDGESEASVSLFEPDEAEQESDEGYSAGEEVVPVQPAKKVNRRLPKVRRTDITAARSDSALAQKRKSVTSSANIDNVDQELAHTSKKPKVAATPTGLRTGWQTSSSYTTPSKGKAPAAASRLPTPRHAATGKSSRGSDTPVSRSHCSTRPQLLTHLCHLSLSRLQPTQTLANTVTAQTDTADTESGGLNDYGGLQDEDDTAEADAIAPVLTNAWKIPGLDSQPNSSDLEDAFPEDKMTEVAHVTTSILRVNHRPAGQTVPSRHRWNTSDLDPEMRQRFTHSFIPLTRTTMSTLPPWYCMSIEERQGLFDRVFPSANHIIEINDMNNRITEWQGKFAAAALTILEVHFVKAGMAEPEVRATWCSEQLGTNVAAMKAPFLWQTWDNGKKKGCFQGELVLKTFGVVHVPVLQALPQALREAEGHSELRPTGALILAVLAVERALTLWLSGTRVIQPGSPGYFSADNWGDKTVVSRGVAKTSNKVANLFARAQKLSCERWLAILDSARDHHRRHKAIQDKQAIVIESASDAPMTESDGECKTYLTCKAWYKCQ
ncbi:hypothetical protein C2E23DRAFT_726617 [Lenzites betulinus]|nr:hypothetical protein C2E23DRAFT_726617 [Lenzites betulinus]